MEQHLIAINRFLKDDAERRPHIRNYWNKDSYSYATDGAILIRVKGDFGKPFSDGVYPDTKDLGFDILEKLSDSDGIIFELTADELEQCGRCHPFIDKNTYVQCTQCDGDGVIECECCGSEINCGNCNGGGKVLVIATKYCRVCMGTDTHYLERVKIGNKKFAMRKIAFLLDNYTNVRFYDDNHFPADRMGFKFDGGMGFIMCTKD